MNHYCGYKPDNVKNFINMTTVMKDYSYGIIPLMQKNNQRYTILIHLASGNHR